MVRKAALLIVLVSSAGCATATPVTPLSSHTIQVAPGQEADVLWMLYGGVLVRCTGQGQRPTCVKVGSQ